MATTAVVTRKYVAADAAQKPVSKQLETIGLQVLLALGAFVMAFPFLWMILTSLKDSSQAFLIPPRWIPEPWAWENYPASLQALPFGIAYFNSLYISVIVVASTLLTASMAAYAFAKINFPGRELVFLLFLATMMVPQQVTIIPLFLIMKWLGWVDTHLAIIVPPALFSAFAVFLLRQFIRGIPRELEEAAMIDGCTRVEAFLRIVFPLIGPGLVATAIFGFIQAWNEYIIAYVLLASPANQTLTVWLASFTTNHGPQWGPLMAAATLTGLPVVAFFLALQRWLAGGLTAGAVKG